MGAKKRTGQPEMPSDNLPQKIDSEKSMVAVEMGRVSQEVQASIAIAKRFPRDYEEAHDKIMRQCERRALAEKALYAYPRGGTVITGPSIRLAEVMAQNWGNLDFGVRELEQHETESIMMSYCWDLETNVRQTKIFTVSHKRHTREGAYRLTDPRDIYEMIANQAARRLRACILGIIPGDIVDAAISACEETMRKATAKDPIDIRIVKMIDAFKELGIKSERLEGYLNHPIKDATEAELGALRKIYRTIKDDMVRIDEFFPPAKGAPRGVDAVLDKVKVKKQEETPAPIPEEKTDAKKEETGKVKDIFGEPIGGYDLIADCNAAFKLADASSEVFKNRSRIMQFKEIVQSISNDYDSSPQEVIRRTSGLNTIAEFFTDIELQNHQKMMNLLDDAIVKGREIIKSGKWEG